MLYLHIPYCKQACSYCNFHFSTNLKGRKQLLAAMQREMVLREEEISALIPETVYLGGGTPSLLTKSELDDLFGVIFKTYTGAELEVGSQVFDQLEITLEANPDDLDDATIKRLADSPVNRLSIGLQSFSEEDLRYMNRAHSAQEAKAAIGNVLKAGFTDLSVDLIYGSPTTNDTVWADNISRVLDYGVPHISAYALTVEPKTALAHQIKTGKSPAPEEGRFAKQFDMLVERLSLAGYEHYEISNFALPGRYSRHNTGYWQGKPYVGIGPAAHSFNGYDQRRWNIANNALYTGQFEALHSWEDYAKSSGLYTIENLSKANRYNEFVMTSLRTKWGVTIEALTEKFGADFAEYFQTSLADSLQHGYFEVQALKKGIFQLNTQGRRLADGIAAEAFFIPEM